jgi:3-oxoadipate CoA-transferase beta subunit
MSVQKRSREDIAQLIAQDIPEGAYVNLGIGLPTKISKYLPTDKDVFLHSENGLLAFGPPPAKGEEDPELINAQDQVDLIRQSPKPVQW